MEWTEKALKILVLGFEMDVYPVACFPLSKKAPIKGVIDGVSRRVDARRFKECKWVTDSYRMKRFDNVVNVKYD